MTELSINKVLREYYDSKSRSQQRLGQWFVNNYVGDSNWPHLFYEANDKEAVDKIYMWLLDNGFEKRMPKKILTGKQIP